MSNASLPKHIGYYSVEETLNHYYLLLAYFNHPTNNGVQAEQRLQFKKGPNSRELGDIGKGRFYAFLNMGREGCILLYKRTGDKTADEPRVFSLSRRGKDMANVAALISELCCK